MAVLAITTPGPYEANPGLVQGVAPRGTHAVEVRIGADVVARLVLPRGRRRFSIGPLGLPARDLAVTVTARGWPRAHGAAAVLGRRTVAPVFGLPAPSFRVRPIRATSPRGQALLRRVRGPGVTAVYARGVRSGRGAADNAGTRFSAASTLKLAILLTSLAHDDIDPVRGGPWFDYARMIRASSNYSANDLEARLGGGSVSAGSALVDDLCRDLGCRDTRMFGGYLPKPNEPRVVPPVDHGAQPPIRLNGKYTTAYDLSLLLGGLVEAAAGRGRLHRLGVSMREARVALWLLLHAEYPGLVRPATTAPVAHKAGWLSDIQHDATIVFTRRGALILVIMTQGDVSLERSQAYGARLTRSLGRWLS